MYPSTRNRFPKSHRLLHRKEFQHTLGSGKKIVNSAFVMLAKRNEGGPCRMGLIVSRRVGNAVVRNRAKRRLRETFRTLDEKRVGFDFVVIARGSIATTNQDSLKRSFAGCLRRLGKQLS